MLIWPSIHKGYSEFTLLSSSRKIAHVIVFGTGRSQNGLLTSPANPVGSGREFAKEIWPTIEHMNQIVPGHSRVVKELVLVEDPQIPFVATDKGTIKVNATLALYADQIERAYQDLEMKQS